MVSGTPRWSNTASTKFRAAGPTRAHRSISQLLRRMSVRSAASALDVRSLFEQMDVIRADVCNQDAAAADMARQLPRARPPPDLQAAGVSIREAAPKPWAVPAGGPPGCSMKIV